jgi:large repetitive protein
MTIDVSIAESLVNTYTPFNQRAPVVAGLADGGYAIAWMNNLRPSPDPTQAYEVFQVSYRVFNADGTARTGEMVMYDPEWILRAQMDTIWQKALWTPSIAAAADGSFTITATSEYSHRSQFSPNSHSNSSIISLTFSPTGQMVSSGPSPALSAVQFGTIQGAGFSSESSTVNLNNHRIIVERAAQYLNATANSDILIHTYDTRMSANFATQDPTATTTVQVTGTFAHALRQPDVAVLSNSSAFVVTWIDDTTHTLQAHVYGLDNLPGSTLGGTPYSNGGTINIGSVASVDSPVTTLMSAPDGQQFQAVAGLAGGGFAVAWTAGGANSDGSGTAVKVRVYNSAGVDVSPEIQVNANSTGNQDRPDILALRDGRFLVSFTDSDSVWNPIRGSIPVLHLQLFDAAGAKSGGESRCP